VTRLGASDIITAVVDEGLGNSSYVVDLGFGRALVVDPERDPIPYLRAAARGSRRIVYSVETHLHADFVSGSRELAAEGAQVLAAAAGHTEFPHRGLDDDEEIDLGGLTLRALATPGHTPEHLSYLLLDGSAPVALFSGGSLLVGSVARTDLIAPEESERLARELWRSLRDRILTLPDDLPVYPTHGAGSFCSAPSGGERTTTIGAEKAANALLSVPDEDTFVKLLLDGLGTYPPYFTRLRDVNRRGPAVFGADPPTLERLDASTVRRRVADGAVIVDVRPIGPYAESHIPGSLSIELRDEFATWLGWLVEQERPIVFVLDRDQDRAEVVRQALKIGYERLEGELSGGMVAWRIAGFADSRIALVPASEVTGTIVDIRQDAEFADGHIPGALHVELGSVDQAQLPQKSLAVMCGHGERAMSAASVLEAIGRTDVAVVLGGPLDWARAAGRSVETGL
jgi:glyoxylase-like metal-dependent hydrolase (beta-lactamase superfamily II)/rhodanese-related sulfurtransferase